MGREIIAHWDRESFNKDYESINKVIEIITSDLCRCLKSNSFESIDDLMNVEIIVRKKETKNEIDF